MQALKQYTEKIPEANCDVGLHLLSSLLLIAGMLTVSLAQAQQPWADIETAARKEGTVFVYTASPVQVLTRLKAGFEKAHPGIVVEIFRTGSAPLIVKVEQERAQGVDGGDVMIHSDIGWATDRVKDGSIKPHLGAAVRALPAKYMIDGVIPVLAVEPVAIAYNTNLVKNPPTGYLDLLKPEYRGKVGVLDISISITVAAYYDWLSKTYGADYLSRLAANKTVFFNSSPVSAQAVAAGEMEISSFVSTSGGAPLIAKGAPIKLVVPKPAFGYRYIGHALGWAKRPNAAQVFMNYITSVPGQTVWSGGGDMASTLPNIPGSLDAGAIDAYDVKLETPAATKAKIEAWNKLFR